ncbi:hypothetical protein QFZ41_003674 [Luteibacter sp. W1I16]|uniref:hypothetical protein n=1 Tax=Luteibacter sp. W1I16 TaxID=3373922 RepID=UPI003D22C245
MSMSHGLESDESAKWKRASALIGVAYALTCREDVEILLKVDGRRDNGRIYTLVVWNRKDDEATFRKDGEDIGELLRSLNSDPSEEAFGSQEDYSDVLEAFDRLARQGAVIGVRIWNEEAAPRFEVTVSSSKRSGALIPSARIVVEHRCAEGARPVRVMG